MKKVFNPKIWRPITVSFAFLLAIVTSGSVIANNNAGSINNALHIDTSTNAGSSSADANYFPLTKTQEEIQSYVDATAKQVELEGMVLLKNENNALPLNKGSKVSLLMQGATKPGFTTSGSGGGTDANFPDMKDSLTTAGFEVNDTLYQLYKNKITKRYGRGSEMSANLGLMINKTNELPWSKYGTEAQESIAQYGDAAIVVLARNSGEGADINATEADSRDGSYLTLSTEEEEIMKQLATMKANGDIKKIVVLLNSALYMQADFLTDSSYGVDAAMWVGNFGTQGMDALVDVLSGKASPSGRLTDTMVNDTFSSPVMANWGANPNKFFGQKYANYDEYKNKINTVEDVNQYYGTYVEGIYVGYRYYETRYFDKVTGAANVGDYNYNDVVAYPFGYGLSYGSRFAYSDFAVKVNGDDKYDVTLKVSRGTDSFDGEIAEPVEIYLSKPYSSANLTEVSAVELVGFDRVSLNQKESKNITITVDKEDFKSYDSNTNGTYILEQGDYLLTAAHDSHEATNNILASKGKTASDGMTENGDASMVSVAYTSATVDKVTYSKSVETGVEVKNELDASDMNKYESKGDNKVTYVSRNNWTGTWPSEAISFKISGDAMASDLCSNKSDDPSLIAEDGAKEVTYGKTGTKTIASMIGKDFNDAGWEDILDQLTKGDVSLLISDAGFHTKEIPNVAKPATKDDDGPTGLKETSTNNVFPSLGVWAGSFDKTLLAQIGDALADDIRGAGYHVLYGPGCNIHRSPYGGRLGEYFSEDPYLTGIASGEVIAASQKKGVLMTLKHFAFNEEENRRNGIGVWLNEQEAREIMLKPFEIACRPSKYNCHSIMSSFNRAGTTWTSADKNLVQGILRDEFGFDGYILTDYADGNGITYMTYGDGIMAGTDLYLTAGGSSTMLDSLLTNKAFQQAARQACHRVLYTMANYSWAMNGLASDTAVTSITPWWSTLLTTLEIVSIIVTCGGFAMTMAGTYLEIKEKNN